MRKLKQLIEWNDETSPSLIDIENELDYQGINMSTYDFLDICNSYMPDIELSDNKKERGKL
jgi:hypothetical protein